MRKGVMPSSKQQNQSRDLMPERAGHIIMGIICQDREGKSENREWGEYGVREPAKGL